jgi:hypothetical protein
MELSLHRSSAWDSPLPPLGECHNEANRLATPWAHWLAAFAHYLLMSGMPPGDTYFGGIPICLVIS